MNDDAWDKVEVDFCAGASFRVLATKYGVSHVAIKKKKDKEGWVKGGKPTRKALRAKALKEKKVAKEKDQKPKMASVTPVNPVNRGNQTVNQSVNPPVNHLQLVKQEVGCPTKKTEELLEAIFEAIADGKSTRVMLAEMGISKRTFYRWARTDREFCHQYACAKQFCADFFIEDIIEIADDAGGDTYINEKGVEVIAHEVIARSSLKIEARKWAAMRLHAKKYHLPFLDAMENDKPAVRRIEVSFVTGEGVRTSGRTFDANGKVVQLGASHPVSP